MPSLTIKINKIFENAKRVVERCARHKIDVLGIAKGTCAHPAVVAAFWEAGIKGFGDSRTENLKAIKSICPDAKSVMIRPPMKSEISEIPLYADRVFISAPEAIESLEMACASLNKNIGLMIMIELGDLRDGIIPKPSELKKISELAHARPHIRIDGVGANFGCFGGVCPTKEKLEELVEIKNLFEKFGHEGLICSGGATSSLSLLDNGMPEGINELRIGEAILLGTDVTHKKRIGWLHQDTMFVEAELIELSRKPSAPFGKSGFDAFGHKRKFPDRGERLRGIAALGRQDVNVDGIYPLLPGVEILGASSDHLILDLEATEGLSWGSVLEFGVDYSAMLQLFSTMKGGRVKYVG